LAVEADAKVNERWLLVLRYLDVVLLVIAVPVAIVLGAPVFGCLVGAGGWMFQRVVGEADRRWTRKVATPLKQLGVNLFEGFARIWLLAGFILIAALVGGRRDGLAASLVILGAYSVAFAVKVLSGPPNRRAAR
jgi:hypothetical protein